MARAMQLWPCSEAGNGPPLPGKSRSGRSGLREEILNTPAQPIEGGRVELRNPRLVDSKLVPNLLHGEFLLIVELDDLPLAFRNPAERALEYFLLLAAIAGLELVAFVVRRNCILDEE